MNESKIAAYAREKGLFVEHYAIIQESISI